mgnify:CR=1 FL=1
MYTTRWGPRSYASVLDGGPVYRPRGGNVSERQGNLSGSQKRGEWSCKSTSMQWNRKNLAHEDMDRPFFTGLNNSLQNRLQISLHNSPHNSTYNSHHNSLHYNLHNCHTVCYNVESKIWPKSVKN